MTLGAKASRCVPRKTNQRMPINKFACSLSLYGSCPESISKKQSLIEVNRYLQWKYASYMTMRTYEKLYGLFSNLYFKSCLLEFSERIYLLFCCLLSVLSLVERCKLIRNHHHHNNKKATIKTFIIPTDCVNM